MLNEEGGEEGDVEEGDKVPTGAFTLPFSAVEDPVDVGITVKPNTLLTPRKNWQYSRDQTPIL